MVRRSALALALVSSAVGCADDNAAFDAEGYELMTTSPLLRIGGGSSWVQPNYWVPEYNGYVPPFCDMNTSFTTVSVDASEVTVDWQGCGLGMRTAVGTFTYAGDGAYEGLIEVTLNTVATPVALLLRLEPRVFE